jgi:hypothetical protein
MAYLSASQRRLLSETRVTSNEVGAIAAEAGLEAAWAKHRRHPVLYGCAWSACAFLGGHPSEALVLLRNTAAIWRLAATRRIDDLSWLLVRNGL